MKVAQAAVKLSWLGEASERRAGVTWGVPWKRGELNREVELQLLDSSGRPVPVQSWTTAYWPDGSVKWTAHAASLPGGSADEYAIVPVQARRGQLEAGRQAETKLTPPPIRVRISEAEIEVDTGPLLCRLGRCGSALIKEMSALGQRVCAEARLTGIRELERIDPAGRVFVHEQFESEITEAVVEQDGPIRAVVKVSGGHRLGANGRLWLPFTLRFVFFAGTDSLRVVHTFLYDGNPHQDYVKGLGIQFKVPLRGELYNRHVRMAGDTGWFAESPKGLMTFRLQDRQRRLYEQQTAGHAIRMESSEDDGLQELLQDSPVWGGFKQSQLSADSYAIAKRTKEGCAWVHAASGLRAGGLLYAGGACGGLAIGLRHFWQKFPSALEVDGMEQDEAVVTAWIWSPDAAAMDLRHYDTQTHVRSCYEGADELRSTPYGIGNTNELTIWCCAKTPQADELDSFVKLKEQPPLLVCEPERYHAAQALGVWSLPDRSTAAKAQLEDTLGELVQFYQREVEQRRWYGLWDYGDFMHSYDPVRHTWKYDIGGCAWQNTELAPNMWLWYMFLRSGREDIFRLAEAMTRHTGEVDLYHIGEYAGLGSRHNVLHWGCGCKEARIGMAGLHRFYYYLTADERVGELLDEVKDSDYATVQLDPMRAYYAKDQYPTHARSGPDWAAFCSNWLTRWERYEDSAYRDKMLVGLNGLKQLPYRLLTGPVFGYDPKNGELHHMGDENWGHHLMICMGGAQVWIEMAQLLDDPEWAEMIAEYGAFYNLPPEEKQRRTAGAIQGKDWNIPMLSTSMMAFAANLRSDAELARQAWGYLLELDEHWSVRRPLEASEVPRQHYVREIKEIPWMSTNTASQWAINVMICLELIGDHLD